MDVRIGVTQAPREVNLEVADEDGEAAVAKIEAALAGQDAVLWLIDRRGKRVAVPAAKIAYVKVGVADGDRRIGFGGTVADLLQLPAGDMRQGQSKCGEIIDASQKIEIQPGPHRADGERPGVIGEFDMIAIDRGGDGDDRLSGARAVAIGQIMLDGGVQRSIIGACQGCLPERPVTVE